MTQSCTKAGGEVAEVLAGLYLVAQIQFIGAIREESISQLQAQPLLFTAHVSVWWYFPVTSWQQELEFHFPHTLAALITFMSQRAKSRFD